MRSSPGDAAARCPPHHAVHVAVDAAQPPKPNAAAAELVKQHVAAEHLERRPLGLAGLQQEGAARGAQAHLLHQLALHGGQGQRPQQERRERQPELGAELRQRLHQLRELRGRRPARLARLEAQGNREYFLKLHLLQTRLAEFRFKRMHLNFQSSSPEHQELVHANDSGAILNSVKDLSHSHASSYQLPLMDHAETISQSSYKVSETVRKRQYRVGLNLFNKKPERGINYLIRRGFLENSPQGVARFLISRKGLSKQMIGEYLGNLQSSFNMAVLECFSHELDLAGMQVKLAYFDITIYFSRTFKFLLIKYSFTGGCGTEEIPSVLPHARRGPENRAPDGDFQPTLLSMQSRRRVQTTLARYHLRARIRNYHAEHRLAHAKSQTRAANASRGFCEKFERNR